MKLSLSCTSQVSFDNTVKIMSPGASQMFDDLETDDEGYDEYMGWNQDSAEAFPEYELMEVTKPKEVKKPLPIHPKFQEYYPDSDGVVPAGMSTKRAEAKNNKVAKN